MKRFFGILNLLLCLELIVGPAAPQLNLLMPQKSFAQESCPAGTAFNSTLNRCLTTEQTTSIMNAVSNCSSGDKACYKANAEEALEKAEEDGKVDKELKNKSGLFGTGMKAAAVAVPLFMVGNMMFGGNKAKKCSSMPLYMMLAGGAAIFIGDMWANKQHKGRLKKIRKEWEAKVQPKDTDTNSANGNVAVTQNAASSEDQKAKATEAQSEAFEMLAKSEDSLASAAKFKSGVYAVGTLAFGAASVMSLMEHMKLMKLKAAAIATPTPEAKVAYTDAYKKAHCSEAIPKEHGASQADYDKVNGSTAGTVDTPNPAGGSSVSAPTQAVQGGSSEGPASNGIDGAGGADPARGGCIKDGITYAICPDSRYESTIKGLNASFDIDKQFLDSQISSLKNAKDLAALMTLNDSFEESLRTRSSPSIEKYKEYSVFYKDSKIDESTELLEIAKVLSIKLLSELNPIPTAEAFGPDIVAPAVTGGEAAANTKKLGMINKYLYAPLPRAGIAGVFAVWSGIMTMHARKQAKVSKDRAEYLRSIKDTFNDATGAISCSSQERTNTANPKCYCYTAEGQRNSQRASSAICTALFTGKTPPAPTNYLNNGAGSDQRVCITSAGVDEKCACRSSNTCLSAIPSNFSGINPGSLSMLSSGLAPFGQVTSGQLAPASVNGASATANAMKMVDAARNMASKEPGLLASMDKAAKDGAAQLTAASAGMSAPSLGDSSSMPMKMNASQAADMLEKELKRVDNEINSVNGGGTFAAPDGKGENLEFGMTAEQLAGDQTALAEVMDQKMDYGQNDINSKSDTNLFEVLSNRYQRSGMRRLFDEEGKAQADKPNKTDVNP